MSLTIKILHTLFVAILVPVYWRYYGPSNFLWFSDVALLLSVVALWHEERLVASTQVLAILVLEIGWTVDLAGRLMFGGQVFGLSGYMFDATIPLGIRLLSLFHLWLPWLLLWMVVRRGYDRRAVMVQTIVCWLLLVVSYFVSTPEENINWVYGLGSHQQTLLPAWGHLVSLMAAIPAVAYLPVHLILKRFLRT